MRTVEARSAGGRLVVETVEHPLREGAQAVRVDAPGYGLTMEPDEARALALALLAVAGEAERRVTPWPA